MSPLVAVLTMMWIPRTPLRLHAHWGAWGLRCGPRYRSEAWGEKSVGGGGAVLST
jgi:hypothetical protein